MISMYNVMKTGVTAGFSLRQPYRNLTAAAVEKLTGENPDGSMMHGSLRGTDEVGRPVREFEVPGSPSNAEAARAAQAIRWSAGLLRQRGLLNAVPALVAGPTAALARGEAVVLRFTNGAVITAAL